MVAPVKGATLRELTKENNELSFNPRTRKGCDGRILVDSCFPEMFQSTHP